MSNDKEAEMANITVFGDYCNFDMELEEIRIFLNEVEKFINITHLHLQANNIKGYDEGTLENLKYHFQHTQGTILKKSILISLIIVLEERIDTYCEMFKKYKQLKVGYKDFKGDLLERFKNYCTKVLDSDFDFQSKLWQDIVGLYEIRNCLVHHSGVVENLQRGSQLKILLNEIKRFRSTIIIGSKCPIKDVWMQLK